MSLADIVSASVLPSFFGGDPLIIHDRKLYTPSRKSQGALRFKHAQSEHSLIEGPSFFDVERLIIDTIVSTKECKQYVEKTTIANAFDDFLMRYFFPIIRGENIETKSKVFSLRPHSISDTALNLFFGNNSYFLLLNHAYCCDENNQLLIPTSTLFTTNINKRYASLIEKNIFTKLGKNNNDNSKKHYTHSQFSIERIDKSTVFFLYTTPRYCITENNTFFVFEPATIELKAAYTDKNISFSLPKVRMPYKHPFIFTTFGMDGTLCYGKNRYPITNPLFTPSQKYSFSEPENISRMIIDVFSQTKNLFINGFGKGSIPHCNLNKCDCSVFDSEKKAREYSRSKGTSYLEIGVK